MIAKLKFNIFTKMALKKIDFLMTCAVLHYRAVMPVSVLTHHSLGLRRSCSSKCRHLTSNFHAYGSSLLEFVYCEDDDDITFTVLYQGIMLDFHGGLSCY